MATRPPPAFADYLVEGGKTWNVDNKWSVRHDNAHVPAIQDHMHIMMKDRQVAVINKDGTLSHGTARSSVPSWLLAKIRDRGLIESELIVEASSNLPLVVPVEVMQRAMFHQELHFLAMEGLSKP